MRISALADHVGVPTSTVRYYERVGLLANPERTRSGYRDYDDGAAYRLLFITRARRMGLTCEQIAERIRELERFAEQLDEVGAALAATPPPTQCRTDLTCCVPETSEKAFPVELAIRRRAES